MKRTACAAPVAFAGLVDYWFGELEPAREAALEEHVFDCAHCSGLLEELAALAEGVKGAFREGQVAAMIPGALYERMKKERLRLREYRLAPGTSVQCTIAASDDFVVARLAAPLAGVKRLDLVRVDAKGAPEARFEDIPFDAATGEVLVCPAPADLRRRPAHTERVRLVAVESAGERVLGEYTFMHTPS